METNETAVKVLTMTTELATRVSDIIDANPKVDKESMIKILEKIRDKKKKEGKETAEVVLVSLIEMMKKDSWDEIAARQRDMVIKADLNQLSTAVYIHYVDYGIYPASN